MKRKEFIRNMSLIGVGLGLAPWKLATANPSIQKFRLPPASVHIPHGNFASSQLEKLTISEINLECSVQLFLRNGIETCESDLIVCSFQRGDEILLVSYTESGESSVEGKIEGLKIALEPLNREHFTVTEI